jgi:hypothetical protein
MVYGNHQTCNIHFFQGAEQLGHDHPKLEYADCVLVTSER